jgi:hypothetical protein
MSEVHQPHASHPVADNPPVTHEETDVNIGAILAFAAALVAVAIVVHLLIWVLFRVFEARAARPTTVEYPLAVQQEDRLPPEPRLQTNPREDLRELRDSEEQVLTTYGWVDRNGGVVRIPIEDAMRLAIERGLPARRSSEPTR